MARKGRGVDPITEVVREITRLLEQRLRSALEVQRSMERILSDVGGSLRSGVARIPGRAPAKKGRRFSAAHRRKLAAAQRRRWARARQGT